MKAVLSFINSFQNNNEKIKIFSSLESILNYFKLNSEIGLFLMENAREVKKNNNII